MPANLPQFIQPIKLEKSDERLTSLGGAGFGARVPA
jgi:hypothetical protein